MLELLAQVKLEDVFRSTQENMDQTPGSSRVVALALGAVGLLVLLLLLQQRKRHEAVPAPVVHQGKLLKEALKSLPLKPAEVKQLRQLADEQACSSPLVLLLCPSLLGKAAAGKGVEERRSIAQMVKRITA